MPIVHNLKFGEPVKPVSFAVDGKNSKCNKVAEYITKEMEAAKSKYYGTLLTRKSVQDPFTVLFHHLVASGQRQLFGRVLPLLSIYPNNEHDQSPLITAILYDQLDIFQQILKLKPFKDMINRKDVFGRTPLHWAALMGQKDMLKLLLQEGCDFLARDCDGNTAVELVAASRQSPASVSIFKAFMECYAHGGLSAKKKGKPTNKCRFEILANRDIKNRNLLHWICFYKRVDLLQALVLYGSFRAEIRSVGTDISQNTPLHMLALPFDESRGFKLGKQVIEEARSSTLLSGKGHLNTSAKIARSMLEPLARSQISTRDTVQMATILISCLKSDALNAPDLDGRTALHYAASGAFTELTGVLLGQKHCDVNKKSLSQRTALHHAAMNGSTNIMLALLERGAEDRLKDSYGATALHYLSAKNHGHCIQSLFEYFKAKGPGQTGEYAIPAYLADNQGRYPLTWAVLKGNVQTCRILVENGVPTALRDCQGGTALHAAAYSGQTMCIYASTREELDYTDNLGETPLMKAVERGYVETAVALYLQGATLESVYDNLGRNVAHHATLSGHLPVCAWLLTCNVNLDVLDLEGNTPLHLAADIGYYDIVKLFVDSGADVNVQNKGGQTPLFLATIANNGKVAQFLVANGAKLNQLDFTSPVRLTTLDYALDPNLIILFRTNGAWSGREIRHYAAQLIQKAYRGFRQRKRSFNGSPRSKRSAWTRPQIYVSSPASVTQEAVILSRREYVEQGAFLKSKRARSRQRLSFNKVPRFVTNAAAVVIQQTWRLYRKRRALRNSSDTAQNTLAATTLNTTLFKSDDKKLGSSEENWMSSLDSVTRDYLSNEKNTNGLFVREIVNEPKNDESSCASMEQSESIDSITKQYLHNKVKANGLSDSGLNSRKRAPYEEKMKTGEVGEIVNKTVLLELEAKQGTQVSDNLLPQNRTFINCAGISQSQISHHGTVKVTGKTPVEVHLEAKSATSTLEACTTAQTSDLVLQPSSAFASLDSSVDSITREYLEKESALTGGG